MEGSQVGPIIKESQHLLVIYIQSRGRLKKYIHFSGQVLYQTIQRPLKTGGGGRWLLLCTQVCHQRLDRDKSSCIGASAFSSWLWLTLTPFGSPHDILLFYSVFKNRMSLAQLHLVPLKISARMGVWVEGRWWLWTLWVKRWQSWTAKLPQCTMVFLWALSYCHYYVERSFFIWPPMTTLNSITKCALFPFVKLPLQCPGLREEGKKRKTQARFINLS